MTDAEKVSPDWRKIAIAAAGVAAVGTLGYIAYRTLVSEEEDKTTNGEKKKISESEPKLPKIAVVQPKKSEEKSKKSEAKELHSANDYKERGNELFKEQKYEEAIKCYTTALETVSGKDRSAASIYYQNRAAAYEKLNQPNKVVSDCSAAIELNRSYTKAYNRRAKANENLGNLEDSVTDLTTVCALESFARVETRMEADRILKLLADQKASEIVKSRGSEPLVPLSVPFVESYLTSFCDDPLLNSLDSGSTETEGLSGFDLAKVRLVQKQYVDVKEACSEEIDANGTQCLQALLLRATLGLLQGYSKQVNEDFDKFFTIFHSLDEERQKELIKLKTNAYIKRASFHMQQGRKDEAMSDFDAAATLDPENADVYHHRGQLYLLLMEIDTARADFNKCVELRPDFKVAKVQSCYAEYRGALKGTSTLDVHKSIEAFERTVDSMPDCAEGYALLGQVYTEREAFEDAMRMYEKAIEMQPYNANYYIHKGLNELYRTEDIDEAKKIMLKGIQLDPNCEFAYETLGNIEMQRGNLPEALSRFDSALELCRTELELTQICGLKEAVIAQQKAAQTLGVQLPTL